MSLHGCRGRNVDRRALIGDGDDIVIAGNDGGLRNIAANGDAVIIGGDGRVGGHGNHLATLWCHELGEYVLLEGDTYRREIDPGSERELSLFQLGLRWLKRCVSTDIDRLPYFKARLLPFKLKPNVNSGKS